MTRVAIIGSEAMGAAQAHACREIPELSVSWVVDDDLVSAAALADVVGARATASVEAALQADDVDAVVISRPATLHRFLTEQAAQHGKHVFCDAPIALTVADAHAMIDACARANVRLMVGHVMRFTPQYARIRQLLLDDAVGQVGVARMTRLDAAPQGAPAGDVVSEAMIHDLDTLRWFFGEVERVYALGPRDATDPVDYAQSIVRFRTGVMAHLEASWRHSRFRTDLEIAGAEGLLHHASDETVALRLERPDTPHDAVPANPAREDPYQLQLRHFAHAITTGEPLLISGEEALRSLEVAVAVQQSLHTKQPVTFIAEAATQRSEA